MARILVHVEGQTEETFVNEILRDHLRQFGHAVSARLLGNARARSRRGGIRNWPTVRGDLIRHLAEDQGCFVTTMVDYYALPAGGERGWPGRARSSEVAYSDKASTVTRAVQADLVEHMTNLDPARFIPYVMMYEFEGLLFSDCERFAKGIEMSELAPRFQEIVRTCGSPEEINDSPLTAPSKRIEELVPGYEKPFMGTLAALEIGLEPMRRECPLFEAWVAALESLPAG